MRRNDGRIRAVNGSIARALEHIKLASSRMVGTATVRNCCVYRKFLKTGGAIIYVQTCFCCSVCKMPMCKESHYDTSIGRYFAYFNDHTHTYEDYSLCNGNYFWKLVFLKDRMGDFHLQVRRNPSGKYNQSRMSDSIRKNRLINIIINIFCLLLHFYIICTLNFIF